MTSNFLASLSEAERLRLREAMDWVIPPDSSPGAGTEEGVANLARLLDSLSADVGRLYRTHLTSLTEASLADPSNAFAALFIEHVRDVYYGSPDSGAWTDIAFEMTG
jgi:hypothetical protein